MTPLVVLAFSAMILSISGYLYKIASGESVWKMNMINYSFWVLGLMSIPGSILVSLNMPFLAYDPLSNSEWEGDLSRKLTVLLIFVWMMIGVPIGAIVNNKLTPTVAISNIMKIYKGTSISAGRGFDDKSLYNFVVFAGVIITLILISFQQKETPLSIVLAGGSIIDAQIARKNLVDGTGVKLFDLMINYQTIQLLCLVSLVMVMDTKQIKWRVAFGLFLSISTYFAISSGITSRLIYFIVSMAFARSITNGIFVRKLEIIFIAPILIAMFVYFKGAEGAAVDILVNDVMSRILLTQNYGMYVALTVFPDMHPFIGFASTAKELHSILGLSFTESYGNVMMMFTQYEGVLAGHAGHLTTLFMGEAWANFGLAGLIIAPLWVGFFVQMVNRSFVRRKRSAVSIAVYSIISTTFGYASDFIGFYYPLGFILTITGIFCLFLIGRYFSPGGSGSPRTKSVQV
jgi:hypothetical protein